MTEQGILLQTAFDAIKSLILLHHSTSFMSLGMWKNIKHTIRMSHCTVLLSYIICGVQLHHCQLVQIECCFVFRGLADRIWWMTNEDGVFEYVKWQWLSLRLTTSSHMLYACLMDAGTGLLLFCLMAPYDLGHLHLAYSCAIWKIIFFQLIAWTASTHTNICTAPMLSANQGRCEYQFWSLPSVWLSLRANRKPPTGTMDTLSSRHTTIRTKQFSSNRSHLIYRN